MHTDALTAVSWRASPKSFVALMALYESNYIRLGWLAGDLHGLAGRHVSRVEGDCELVLDVRDQSPYTTTIDLTYLLADAADASLTTPDMRVRVYHDARLAEARNWAAIHVHRDLSAMRSRCSREMDVRWARNVMLNKWLEYCADRGHRFAASARNAPA